MRAWSGPAAVGALVAATSWVLADHASAWLVPPYLVVMTFILGVPRNLRLRARAAAVRRAVRSRRVRAGGAASPPAGPDDLSVSRPRSVSDGDGPARSDAPADESSALAAGDESSPGDDPVDPAAEPGPAAGPASSKARRGRGRPRKPKGTPAPEPSAPAPAATWVRIGPGKFVRADAASAAVGDGVPAEAAGDPGPEAPGADGTIPFTGESAADADATVPDVQAEPPSEPESEPWSDPLDGTAAASEAGPDAAWRPEPDGPTPPADAAAASWDGPEVLGGGDDDPATDAPTDPVGAAEPDDDSEPPDAPSLPDAGARAGLEWDGEASDGFASAGGEPLAETGAVAPEGRWPGDGPEFPPVDTGTEPWAEADSVPFAGDADPDACGEFAGDGLPEWETAATPTGSAAEHSAADGGGAVPDPEGPGEVPGDEPGVLEEEFAAVRDGRDVAEDLGGEPGDAGADAPGPGPADPEVVAEGANGIAPNVPSDADPTGLPASGPWPDEADADPGEPEPTPEARADDVEDAAATLPDAPDSSSEPEPDASDPCPEPTPPVADVVEVSHSGASESEHEDQSAAPAATDANASGVAGPEFRPGNGGVTPGRRGLAFRRVRVRRSSRGPASAGPRGPARPGGGFPRPVTRPRPASPARRYARRASRPHHADRAHPPRSPPRPAPGRS